MKDIDEAPGSEPLETLIAIYDMAIDDVFLETLHRTSQLIGCECRYTKIPSALGKGDSGERGGSWEHPGENNVLFCAASASRIRTLAGELQKLKTELVARDGPLPYYDFKLIILPTTAIL